MKKIETLTPEQESLFTIYRDKWLKIGLATGPADRTKAEDAIRRSYQTTGLAPPKQIIWSTSPLAGWITVCVLKNDDLMKKIYKYYLSTGASVGDSVGDSVRDSVRASVGASVGDSVGDSVWDSVWASVGASVRDSVGDSVRDSVRASVRDSVGDSVRDSVRASVRDSVRASVRDSVRDSVGASVRDSVRDSVGASVGASVENFDYYQTCYGSHDAEWLGFYDYFLEVLKLESCQKLIPLMDLAQEGGWFYPYQNICVISEKPTQIHMKGTRIHKDGGPAVAYSDGFSVWALNGVRLSQEIAETPAEKLPSTLILKEKNAQVRAEIVKKIGIERIVKDLGSQTIDTWKDYELILLDLQDGRHRPYLKMKNPSVDLIHIEGVPPEVKTVKEALAWRMGLKKFVQPDILT